MNGATTCGGGGGEEREKVARPQSRPGFPVSPVVRYYCKCEVQSGREVQSGSL